MKYGLTILLLGLVHFSYCQTWKEMAKDLNVLTNIREGSFDVAMSNSFGFGGTNASLVFRRYDY